MTYGELEQRATRLAHALRANGVVTGTVVGVCLDRSVDFVAVILGVLKAGGAYVPLDRSYPPARLAVMVEEAGIELVVSDGKPGAPPAARSIALGDLEARAPGGSTALTSQANGESLAYVMFTSGSTGRPKAVAVPHRAVVRLVRNTDFLQIDATHRVLGFAPLSFDASTLELWGPLLNGGTLVLFGAEQPSLADLGRFIEEQRVTTAWLTAALFRQIVDHELPRLGGLRYLLAGGDVISPEHVRRVLTAFPELVVINGYGPTENTTFTACHRIQPGDVTELRPIPLGRPIANTTVYVLDELGALQSIGEPGELFTGGDGLALGYLHQPALTAERFVADPFGPPGGRLYRTGDRARWRADGVLEYLGRVDYQVKLRGYRIELGEIESVLMSHPAVSEAVATLREDLPGIKSIAAYYVPAQESPDLDRELRRLLESRLPDYMVPGAMVRLEALPLGPNGKVNRAALPRPGRIPGSGERVMPASPREAALATVWREVLQADDLGVDDNFFALGGDSILAIQILARCRSLGVMLTPQQLFRHPTIRELAREVGSGGTANPGREASAEPDSSRFPLSPMQQGLLVHSQFGTGSGEYVAQVRFQIAGGLRVPAFRRAWEQLVERHAVLRTGFLLEGVEEPAQAVSPRVTLPWREEDWTGIAPSEQRGLLGRLLIEDQLAGFDLAAAPLIRVTLIQTADQQFEVLWTFHHLVLDGWSVSILLEELGALYGAAVTGAPADLQSPGTYRDYVTQAPAEPHDAEEFWRGYLKGFAEPTPLAPSPRASRPRSRYLEAELELTTVERETLEQFARSQHIAFNTLLQAAWAILLSRYTGSSDVVFGQTVTVRPISLDGIDRMAGLFLNTLPVRVRLPAAQSVSAFLSELHRRQIQLRDHDNTPLADIQRWSEVPRGTALFESLLVLQNYPGADALTALRQHLDVGTYRSLVWTHYPLTVTVIPGDRLRINAVYDAARFDGPQISRMLDHFRTALAGLVTASEGSVGEVAILSPEERHRTVVEWNATDTPYPADLTLTELLERQARCTPNAVAVSTEAARLSFSELHAEANRLAHHLRELGVGPGVLVAICAERSHGLVIGLLAILKAGGAYVPIDPENPADRLQFMLQDTAPALLLTQEHLLAGLPPHSAHIFCLDRDWAMVTHRPTTAPAPTAGPGDPAYMIYTSGSTGRPKGALNAHRGIVNRLLWMQDHFRLLERDVVLQKTPISFDVSVWELFLPLLTGARLLLAKPGGHRDPAYLAQVIERERVTVIHFVPWMLRAFMSESDRSRCGSLREVICSGEALPYDLMQLSLARLPARMTNLYGPTEAAVDVTCWTCDAGYPGATVPIGRPIANSQVYVVDPLGDPVPVGVAGELLLGGVQVGLGYHNRPELTAERFIPDRFRPGAAARLYRTGDLARFLEDGNVEFLGRIDHQVKLRGYRIELGEIEAALASHPSVREAVVLLREDEPEQQRLVAYVSSDRKTLDDAGLREYLAKRLPEYMIPAAFVRLREFPMTPSGKLDRRALPAPEGRRIERFVSEPPASEMERQVAALFQEVLRSGSVGRRDDFFAMGGDSLSAMRIAVKLREAFGVEVPFSGILEHRTPASLAAEIERRKADTRPAAPSGPIRARPRGDPK